jgi:hypothetical protein
VPDQRFGFEKISFGDTHQVVILEVDSMLSVFSKLFLIGIFLGLTPLVGFSQNVRPTTNPKTKKPAASTGSSGWEKSWSIKARLFTTFDSNFDHEPIGTKSVGLIPSVEAGYQLQKDRHRLQFQYTIGVPRYSNFSEYNRRGQYFKSAYRYTIGKGWSTETELEALLKGTNEDRELNNQYIVTQKLNYRVTKKDKLGLYGAFRLKRDSVDPNQNAKNPQIGIKYTRQLTKKMEVYGGFRYDSNIARGLRQRYIRKTYSAGADIALTKNDAIGIEFRYAPRLYGRLIEVNGADVPRSDKKSTLDINWKHAFSSRFGIETNYQFEKRTSNDVDKIYNNHQFVISFYYRWGNGDVK